MEMLFEKTNWRHLMLFSRVNPNILKTLSDTALIVCDQGDYLAGEEERRVRGQFC
jgi:hypothetical protein